MTKAGEARRWTLDGPLASSYTHGEVKTPMRVREDKACEEDRARAIEGVRAATAGALTQDECAFYADAVLSKVFGGPDDNE